MDVFNAHSLQPVWKNEEISSSVFFPDGPFGWADLRVIRCCDVPHLTWTLHMDEGKAPRLPPPHKDPPLPPVDSQPGPRAPLLQLHRPRHRKAPSSQDGRRHKLPLQSHPDICKKNSVSRNRAERCSTNHQRTEHPQPAAQKGTGSRHRPDPAALGQEGMASLCPPAPAADMRHPGGRQEEGPRPK